MSCISPMSIKRPDGKGAKDRIKVPCGKCVGCLSRKRAEWSFRLYQELLSSETALFVTLTYSDDNLPNNRSVSKREMQLYLKLLREKVGYKKIRYFLTGEYGGKYGRPHYHILLFNFPFCLYDRRIERLDFYGFCQKYLSDIWNKGFVSVGSITGASIYYTAKYCISKHIHSSLVEKPFCLMSRRPGIGSNYLSRSVIDWHKGGEDLKNYVVKNGVKLTLPRYYKDKIFNDLDKERIKSEIEVLFSKDAIEDFENYGYNSEVYFKNEFERKENWVESSKSYLEKCDKL